MQSVKTDGFSPHKSAKLEVTATGGEGTVLDDSNVKEPEAIIPRTSPEGSPSSSSSRLFALTYAGNIQHVMEIGEVDDEQWEEDVAGYPEPEWIAPGGGGGDDQVDEGRPPEVDPDELAQLDEAAGFEEIKRFLEMKVVEEPSAEDLEQGVVLSTKSVMDWRFRNQKWQRRCRYVAREFELETKDQQQPLHLLQVLVPGWFWWHTVALNGCWHSYFSSVRRSWWRSPLGGLMNQAQGIYWSLSKMPAWTEKCCGTFL